MRSAFPYAEPSTAAALVLLSYLLLLNIFGWLAQHALGAGLLGQILIGIIYGSPLTGWLEPQTESTLVTLGYAGLLLVVFEGGLTASPRVLLALLPLSAAVALTGILLPIALSFVLVPLSGAAPLHAFAAGAALSTTSLGTVLALLSPHAVGIDLRPTRLGTVLLSAAVLDDVVALVLVKVLQVVGDSTSGDGGDGIGAAVGRTVGVTIGLALALFATTHYVLSPAYSTLQRHAHRWKQKTWGGRHLMVVLMGLWFICLIAAAGYAGTSVLFGAYVAGLSVAYVSEREGVRVKRNAMLGNHRQKGEEAEGSVHALEQDAETESDGCSGERSRSTRDVAEAEHSFTLYRSSTLPSYPLSLKLRPAVPPLRSTAAGLSPTRSTSSNVAAPIVHSLEAPASPSASPTFPAAFEHYLSPLLNYLLLPLFFGSIGYSIPFVPLWRGGIIWRGIVYAGLMALGKLGCGLWLGVWPVSVPLTGPLPTHDLNAMRGQVQAVSGYGGHNEDEAVQGSASGDASSSSPTPSTTDAQPPGSGDVALCSMPKKHGWEERWRGVVVLGLAMVARGEIGLLISQVAYRTTEPLLAEDEFLQVIWAIILCTIVGPVGISIAIKRWGRTLLDGPWGIVQ